MCCVWWRWRAAPSSRPSTLTSWDLDTPYEMLIDANDPRGIDVGLFSKYPIKAIATHMFDKVGSTKIFSRDCLEVELETPSGQPLFLLINHFKSKGYDYDGTADAKRKRQATRVADILKEKYKLSQDWVVVGSALRLRGPISHQSKAAEVAPERGSAVERRPYKEEVGGSKPPAPTRRCRVSSDAGRSGVT
jgi:hypothetical protein